MSITVPFGSAYTGPPALANVKQVLTILLSVVIFDLTITSANALGILVTIGGGGWYAWVEHEEKALRLNINEKRIAVRHTSLS